MAPSSLSASVHWSRVVSTGGRSRREVQLAPFPLEVAVVWALFALLTVEILATYSRLPAHELYHVSGSGLTGGASRALVFLNFPAALVAIPIIAFFTARLPGRSVKLLATIGIVLSAAIFWPGIVKQSDLDARSVNAIAALGVLVAASLTVVAALRLGRPARPVRQSGDRLRLIVASVALALAFPWIGADLGLSYDGVPVLGTLYQTGELRSQPGVPEFLPAGEAWQLGRRGLHTAVHHGHHHGMDGVLLVLTVLLLSRLLRSVPGAVLRGLLGAYLALMLCYGAGNIANDFWLEQVVKRGWTEWEIPDVTTPKASIAWGVIVLAAAALWAISFWRGRHASAGSVSPRPEAA